MSKIELYKEADRVAKSIEQNYKQALGLDSDSNDKHDLHVSYYEKHSDNWNDATLHLHASYGYYGSSSGYSAMDKHTARYFVKALNNRIGSILKDAVELAKKDAEKARLEAAEEAKDVLELTK